MIILYQTQHCLASHIKSTLKDLKKSISNDLSAYVEECQMQHGIYCHTNAWVHVSESSKCKQAKVTVLWLRERSLWIMHEVFQAVGTVCVSSEYWNWVATLGQAPSCRSSELKQWCYQGQWTWVHRGVGRLKWLISPLCPVQSLNSAPPHSSVQSWGPRAWWKKCGAARQKPARHYLQVVVCLACRPYLSLCPKSGWPQNSSGCLLCAYFASLVNGRLLLFSIWFWCP